MQRLLTVFALFLGAAALPAVAQETVLLEEGSATRYLANASNPGLGLTWTTEAFVDGGWLAGTYGVGYETGSGALDLIRTAVPSGAYSIYTRATFNLVNASTVDNLFLGVDYDDGYVAWVNGVEVARSSSMPSGDPSWNTNSSLHESSNGSEPSYGTLLDISAASIPVIHDGDNVLAIGVWNSNAPGSSDLVVVPKLVANKTAGISRGPYLQNGTPTSVTVRWRTDLAMSSRVRYGAEAGNLTSTVSDGTFRTEHAVTLSGLTADTRYYYAVGSSTADLAGDDPDHFFVTSPLAGTPKPTRIWVLGDSGTANADARDVRDAYYGFTGPRHTDLWLMLGDNAYPDGTDGQYQAAVFDTYPEMLKKSVVWATLGNHDGHSADSATQSGPYYDIFSLPAAAEAGGVASGTEAYYSFDHGNIHFVCLDSYETDRSAGGAMMTWIEQDLLDTPRDWIIAFWHHPPYTKGSHDSDTEDRLIEMREIANPILEDNGVDLVLSGHSHSYERSLLIDGHYGPSSTFGTGHVLDGGDGDPAGDGAYQKPEIGPDPHEGTVYAVAGSSGKISGGALNHPAMHVSMNALGSMVLDVNGNRLDAVFLDDAGIVRDAFTLVKDPSLLPMVDFEAEPTSGTAPLTVGFTDLSVNGPVAWSWDVDDDLGVDGVEQHPVHEYTSPGLYTVALTVSNVAGQSHKAKADLICVASPSVLEPVASLAFGSDAVTGTWASHPLGVGYDVVTGDLNVLRSSGGDFGAAATGCLVDNTAATEVSDAGLPSTGKGFFYLVRAVDCGDVEGTWDAETAGQVASRNPGIESAPVSCP